MSDHSVICKFSVSHDNVISWPGFDGIPTRKILGISFSGSGDAVRAWFSIIDAFQCTSLMIIGIIQDWMKAGNVKSSYGPVIKCIPGPVIEPQDALSTLLKIKIQSESQIGIILFKVPLRSIQTISILNLEFDFF